MLRVTLRCSMFLWSHDSIDNIFFIIYHFNRVITKKYYFSEQLEHGHYLSCNMSKIYMEKLFQIFDQKNKVKSRELFKQGLVQHIRTVKWRGFSMKISITYYQEKVAQAWAEPTWKQIIGNQWLRNLWDVNDVDARSNWKIHPKLIGTISFSSLTLIDRFTCGWTYIMLCCCCCCCLLTYN